MRQIHLKTTAQNTTYSNSTTPKQTAVRHERHP